VLLDRFLDLAIEVDVDAVSDGEDVLIGGIMEHIEQAGVHSGDSGCSLPPNGLSKEIQDELRAQTRKLAKALNVVGLMNIQFAIQAASSTSSRSIRAPRAPCRSSPRRPACRSPRSRRAS
jgi:carbamoyl-phosphate synthase large subunit